MSDVYIEEYSTLARSEAGFDIQATGRRTAKQKVASSVTTANSAAFNADTTYIVVTADAAVHFNLGDDSVEAANTDPYLPANTPRAFGVAGYSKIAVLDKS